MQRAFLSPLPLMVLGCLIPTSAKAQQVTPDGTTSTTVNRDGNDFTIEQGNRAGDNLFHSFDEFSVPTQGSAAFNNTADIANIFSRVTGSNISSIDGLLSANGVANLYLINPNGIIFGENASLDLGGSFFASTANSLLFEGGEEFSASNPQAAPLLEVSIPIGLSFRDNPGDIVNRFGDLLLEDSKTLAFIGGDVRFERTEFSTVNIDIISLPGANLEIGGITEAGTIEINDDNSVSFPDNVVRGNISFNGSIIRTLSDNGGSINISGRDISFDSSEIITLGENGGSINISGRDISLTNDSQITIDRLNGAEVSFDNSDMFANRDNKDSINIQGENLELNNISFISATNEINLEITEDLTLNNSFINDMMGEEETRDSVNINIDADDVNLINGGQIRSAAAGPGQVGNINISVNNLNILTGRITAETGGQGDGGNITINATDTVLIDNQIIPEPIGPEDASDLLISPEGREARARTREAQENGEEPAPRGNAGSVNISTSVTPSLAIGNFTSDVVGNAGSININSPNLTITNDGQINSEADTRGLSGNAGSINIDLINDLDIINGGSILASTNGQGNAGEININAQNNIVIDGISSGIDRGQPSRVNAGDPSRIASLVEPGAEGNSEGISLSSRNLTITNGGRVDASTLSEGNSGLVDIDILETITIDGENLENSFPSSILSLSFERGNSQGVSINTQSLNLTNRGSILTVTGGQGNAGTIDINANESVIIDSVIVEGGFPSGLYASAIEDSGNGGDINLFTDQLILNRGGRIEVGNLDELNLLSSIPGTGEPGNINIEVNSLSLNDQASINATTQSETGNSANINLTISEDIRLENNSSISARAEATANGGNVFINADNGFILASTSNGNNDIIARAEQGDGGQLEIFTQALFGLEERSSTPDNRTNDIDLTSQSGLQGDFALSIPDFDPTSGLINLPPSVGDASDQISQNPCQQGVGSEFRITGKGGLPPTVNEALNSESSQVGLIKAVPSQRQAGEANNISADNPTPEVKPAMGWVFSDKGEVTLTAHANTDTNIKRSPQQTSSSCSASSQKTSNFRE